MIYKALLLIPTITKLYYTLFLSGSVIYQLLDIRTDDQIPEGEIWSVIYQTCCFMPNILLDDYVIHFLAFQLEHFDCTNIP